jgi:branched-chain amino acid transport system permease protein
LGANQPSGGSDLWSKIFANAPLILGSILIAFVLLVPKGLVPTLSDIVLSVFRRQQRQEQRGLAPQEAE